MTCSHEIYKKGSYLTDDNALKAMRANKYCWISKIITHCETCKQDISYAKVVRVKTVAEYLRGLK